MNTAKCMLKKEKKTTMEIATIAEFNFHDLRSFMHHVSEFYPEFGGWLNFKFLRGLNNGDRKALIIKDNGEIAGLSLLKITQKENKICTFFVAPEHRGKGFGTELMKSSLEYFYGSVDITVCEERNASLYPFLEKHGFHSTSQIEGIYRPGVVEFYYTR
ncbi:GNAT family N-acetyltransferase [Pectobacterium brasiliense]|uniref:GNAT family N-acetyltransferase n=1 Tax=Pectobacterium brasiliense TaxID=180957 RepID=UPI002406C58B|nr:GNAT family N-acetyltransferase [Pectobacterium brasiliense]MDG0806817.1 GNAT family N-acetyltransferase [Pectobacterium brasiliense]